MGQNVDKYGHCVLCHRNLIVKRIVDGKPMNTFHPDREETEYLLDDGSKMRVCICRECKKSKDLSDDKIKDSIMEAVVNGWELELRDLVADKSKPNWTAEKVKSHMDVYRNKKIILHSESVDKHTVENRIKEIVKGKDK